MDLIKSHLDECLKRRPQNSAGIVNLDPFPPQQHPLLVKRDALAVARPPPFKAAELAARRHNAVARDLGREGVAAQRVADGAGRRAEMCGEDGVGGDLALGHLAQGCPDALLVRGACRGGDAGELGAHVFGVVGCHFGLGSRCGLGRRRGGRHAWKAWGVDWPG
ncbi:hypothetical protein HYQ46_006241 [Verticillium longisporum]|nr:hypothetical protein HYQ46_006241 [Verticillium longisporum]